MDDVLRPTRTAAGARLYDPDVVERVRAERAARHAERDAQRATDAATDSTVAAPAV